MALVSAGRMLSVAADNRFAVGYFEAWSAESVEAVVEAAESAASPVIIGFGGLTAEPAWFDRWGLREAAALGGVAAETATIPVSLILNEVATVRHCLRGIELGFNYVMLDCSSLSYDESIVAQREIVAVARRNGVCVEAELGELPISGADGTGELTAPTPREASLKRRGSTYSPSRSATSISGSTGRRISISIFSTHSIGRLPFPWRCTAAPVSLSSRSSGRSTTEWSS